MKKWISVMVLAVLITGFVLLCLPQESRLEKTAAGSDSMTYYYSGKNLIKYGVITEDRDGSMYGNPEILVPSSQIAVGFPVYLSLLFRVFPDAFHTVFISNIVLGAITLILAWLIMREMEIPLVLTAIATGLIAVFPTSSDMTGTCLTENLFFPLMMASVYFMVRRRQSRYSYWLQILMLGLASTVRAQALLFLPLQILCCEIRNWKDINNRVRKILTDIAQALAILLILYIPIWIGLYRQSGSFVLYPSAQSQPRIWGVMPYYIDMPWSYPYDLKTVAEYNRNVAPEIYTRWRIFGLIWRSWFECWSEDLAHGSVYTHWALLLHEMVVLPALILIPFFSFRYRWKEKYLGTIPLILTLGCMYTHGLPRYVAMAYPYMIILLVSDIRIILCRQGRQVRLDCWIYAAMMSVFSALVAFSVFIFAWQVDAEQSEYRLRKYGGLSISDIVAEDRVMEKVYPGDQLIVWNTENMGGGVHRIPWEDHAIVSLEDLPVFTQNEMESVVTKVTVDVEGGSIHDDCIIFWLDPETEAFTDRKVYTVPRSSLNILDATRPEVFIDGDVTRLLIVPALYHGNVIHIREIRVEKYRVPGTHE